MQVRTGFLARRVQITGVSPEVLGQRLGHSDVSITLSLYAHVRPSDDQAAASLVASVIDGQSTEAP